METENRMKRDNIFWGTALIIAGVLLYLQTQGIISNVLTYLWPVALILVGGWLILNVYWPPADSAIETFSVPLGSARSARVRFAHGAGQIEIRGGAPAGQALVGPSAAGMDRQSRMEGEKLDVRVEAGPSFVPFLGPAQGVWRFRLTQAVPLSLVVESGASTLDLDLRNVLATSVELKTGASSSNVTMPERGVSFLEVEAGVASVNIHVPEATAARIRVKEGVNSVNVDTARFPRLDSGLYQSSDFDTASNRTEIHVEAGLGSVSVK